MGTRVEGKFHAQMEDVIYCVDENWTTTCCIVVVLEARMFLLRIMTVYFKRQFVPLKEGGGSCGCRNSSLLPVSVTDDNSDRCDRLSNLFIYS